MTVCSNQSSLEKITVWYILSFHEFSLLAPILPQHFSSWSRNDCFALAFPTSLEAGRNCRMKSHLSLQGCSLFRQAFKSKLRMVTHRESKYSFCVLISFVSCLDLRAVVRTVTKWLMELIAIINLRCSYLSVQILHSSSQCAGRNVDLWFHA